MNIVASNRSRLVEPTPQIDQTLTLTIIYIYIYAPNRLTLTLTIVYIYLLNRLTLTLTIVYIYLLNRLDTFLHSYPSTRPLIWSLAFVLACNLHRGTSTSY